MLMLFLCLEFLFYPRLCDSETRPLKYAVNEESRKETYIGNIIADTNAKTDLTLIMHSADGKADRLLKLESKSGSLFTAVVIDREKICNSQDQHCYIEAAVQVALGRWINILVEIKDINDHTPSFQKEGYQYTLSEKVEIGYSLRLETAHDSDFGVNSQISYNLEKQNEAFKLENSKERGLHLVITAALDYENEKMRKTTLTLMACDAGIPKLCGSTDILIQLTDVNDNAPYFEKPEFQTLVEETVSINSIVFTFSAFDKDSGNNGKVKYSIIDTADSVAKNYFNIMENGHLKVTRSLENLNVEEIRIKVLAEDFGSPSLRTTCVLRMKIMDVNNHKPEIKITFVSSMKIMENQPTGTLVALISVVDVDKGKNGITRCQHHGTNDALVIKHENRIKNNDFYNLVTTRIIDREVDNMFHVSIICTDEGEHPLTGFKNFTLEVGDENEYRPTFQNPHYSVNVSEDADISTTIFKLFASDKDATWNFTYRFLHDSNYFYINPKSGGIIVKSKLDREDIDIFKLKCSVADNTGGKTFTATAMLTVTLLDVNDNAPKLMPPKNFQVTENSPTLSTPIGFLTATDEDIGDNGKVKFEVLRIDVATGVVIKNFIMENIFQIDRTKGQIFLMTTLDREEASKYKITIRLSDKGSKPLFTEESIEIDVLDKNDNAPKFNLAFTEYNISLPMNYDIPVFRVKATDIDADNNANITYSLLSGSQYFKLNAITGQLYATKILKEGAFELLFQACDNGSPPLNSNVAHVLVQVWPASSYGLSSEEKERIDSLLIIIIASSTCVVFLCLLSAIIIVKWHRDPRNPHRTPKQNDNDDDNDSSTLQKWTDQQNQYTLSIGNQYYRPTSVMSQEMGNEEPDKNNMCSMFHFRYPFAQELEMSSADSGKGTIEEENIILDLQGKGITSNRNYMAMINPYQTSLLTRCSSTFLTGNSSPKFDTRRYLDTNLPPSSLDANPYQTNNFESNQTMDSSLNIPLSSFLAI